MGALLGNAVATLATSFVVGVEGGRAYVTLIAAPHHKMGPELSKVRRQARLALGLFILWATYTFVRIFI